MPTPAPAAQMSGVAVDRAEPWKEDGNIVLAAQGNHFRVHRSVLSAYSEVFRDMFDCPHPNEAENEFVEFCPVIRLHDAATDVQIMLKAMYDRGYPLPCYEKMPISVVAAFLHLGEKYAIPTLVKEAKAKLCCAFDLTRIHSASWLSTPFKANLFPVITDGDPHNFQIMNLLEEMELKAPLPIAMYQCVVTCPWTDIVEGYRVDGTFYALSATNLQSAIRMKEVLKNYRTRLARSLSASTRKPQKRCKCLKSRLWSEDPLTTVPPFDSWEARWHKAFCDRCEPFLKAKRETAVHWAWDQLPTMFGFDSWAEVKKSGDFPSFTIRACYSSHSNMII